MDKQNFQDKIKMFNSKLVMESPVTKNRSTTVAINENILNKKKEIEKKEIEKKEIENKNKPKMTENKTVIIKSVETPENRQNPKKVIESPSKKNKAKKFESPLKKKKCLLKRASAIYDDTKEFDTSRPNLRKSKKNLNIKDNDTWIDLNDLQLDPFSEELDESNIEAFDEKKYTDRKYNSDNIKNGKKFFKMRYIKNKSKTKSNSKELTLSILDKEKNLRLYNSDFLLTCEKAILSFNHKEFQESYNILLSSNIVRDTKEFGEFLFVVSGFDKYLIGEYLAKQKPPNEKGEVLNSFINSINMKHGENSLLECVRFLLSRINLPKDANLILVIMETFTSNFFKENKDDEEFLDIFANTNNIYLLVSTLLALNTMFTRKDIKNMNAIKKDEFIKMNNNVREDYLSSLYDQLKSRPITMVDDYNESIYQKITALVTQGEREKKQDKNDKAASNKTPGNTKALEQLDNDEKSINFDTFTKEDEELLCNINKFFKISGAKTPNLYTVVLFYDDTYNSYNLYWDKAFDFTKIKKSNHINIMDINEIYNGKDIAEHSSHIKKYIKANPNEEKLCNTFISISYNNYKDNLNFKSDNLELTLSWFKALKRLLNKLHNEESDKNKSQTDEQIKERENSIKELWEKHILPKWDKYGNYLILKLQEKNNFYNYIINDQKLSTKNELLFDDKKNNYNNRYIHHFLDNIKENINKKEKDIDINEFYFLCNLGFPSDLRKNLWRIIIGNPCYLSEKLYNSIKSKITDIELNFAGLESKYEKNKNVPLKSEPNINQIITDILIANKDFINDIKEQKLDKYELMSSIYKIIRVLFTFRNDIPYNKIFIDIAYLFLINEGKDGKEEFAFMNIINFLSNNNLIKLFLGNEELRKDMISKNISLFNKLIKNRLPKIEEHFTKLEIIPELYFVPWMDDLYIKVLNMKILLQVFDLYLTNGEYILFQTGLTILKILEDELMNMTISQVLNLIKRLPDKYKKERFFVVFNTFNSVKFDYADWKRQNEINIQKIMLNS